MDIKWLWKIVTLRHTLAYKEKIDKLILEIIVGQVQGRALPKPRRSDGLPRLLLFLYIFKIFELFMGRVRGRESSPRDRVATALPHQAIQGGGLAQFEGRGKFFSITSRFDRIATIEKSHQ